MKNMRTYMMIIMQFSFLFGLLFGEETEIIEKRNFTAKTYRLDDGAYKKVLSVKPMHYRDNNGNLVDIQKGPQYKEQLELAIQQMQGPRGALAKAGPSMTTNDFGAYSEYTYQKMNIQYVQYWDEEDSCYYWRDDTTYSYETGYSYYGYTYIGFEIETNPDSLGPGGVSSEIWRSLLSWNTAGSGISEDGSVLIDSLKFVLGYYEAFTFSPDNFIIDVTSIGEYSITDEPTEDDYVLISDGDNILSADICTHNYPYDDSLVYIFTSGVFYDDFLDCWENQKSKYTIGIKHQSESFSSYEPPESKYTWLNNSYVVLYYHLREVKLVNEKYGESNNNLGGTLSLDNLEGHTDQLNKTSGTYVPVFTSENYTVKTHSEWLMNEQDSLKHLIWEFNSGYKLINTSFLMDPIYSKLNAQFTEPSNITLSSDAGTLSIRDPWYVSDTQTLSQPNTFRVISPGSQKLFLNQGNIENLQPPYYSLRVPQKVVTTSDIMVFDYWSVSPANGALFADSTLTETGVVFKQAGATVTAHYVSANATGRTVTVNAGETLSLPTNATYNITPGNFGIDVYGTLIINESASQPVTFQSNAASPSQSDWKGIKAFNGSAVAIRYVTLKNAQNPIWIFSNNSTSTRYIENCTVDNCYKGIIFDGSYVTSDYLYEELTIKNNLIKNSGSSSNPDPAIDVKGTFEDLKIENNIVQNCHGGIKVSVQYASKNQVTGPEVRIDHNVIHHLVSSEDPEIGIEIIDTTPQYYYPIIPFAHIYNNTVDNIEGNGLYTNITCSSYWKVQNLIVSSISQSDGQAGYGIYNGGSTVLNVKYCDIYNCETGTTHGCNTYEIITDNPLFINPGSYNYHLQTNSPCVNAGNPNFDGDYVSYETDPDDQDPDHTRMDIGAYFCDYPPATPTGFDGVWYNNHPKVFWNAVADPDLKEYQVWKKKNSGLWSLKGTTSNLFYVDNSESKWTKPLISATIYYKVCAVDEGDNTSGFTSSESFICNNTESDKKEIFPVVELNPIPTEYALHPAFPNPFNPRTTICYDVPTTSSVKVTVFDLLGREVRALVQGEAYPGFHRIEWDGANNFGATVSSGIYFIQMDCPEYHALIKCVLNR